MPEAHVLRGATVVDGTGSPGQRADVLVDGDRIAALLPPGSPVPDAATVHDVEGRHVVPGFIDVHSHDDLALLRDPWLVPKIAQGVTTVIVGNCGHGTAPLGVGNPMVEGVGAAVFGPAVEVDWTDTAGYLKRVAEVRPAVNVAALAAHNALRIAICGLDHRPATRPELDLMVSAARAARDAGALGLSTGLGYEPARAADEDEIVELARVFASTDGLYVTHLRDESDGVEDALREALRIGERSGCAVHVSHLKCAGERNWGRMPDLLKILSRARATADVYPYTAASTALRPALGAVGEAPLIAENYVIATASGFEEIEGRSLADLAAEWGCSGLEAARRVLERTDDQVTVVYFTMAEADVAAALADEITVIGSDGLPVGGRPHPRLYGTFPRVLTRHVAGEPHLSFEAAVHRMTGRAADVFGLGDRGRLVPGGFADLVVLDRERLTDRATYEDPRQTAAGIEAVMVNGAWVHSRDLADLRRSGRVLRGAGYKDEGTGRA
ncbi:N-acyl-D-amino-acid deacylase family protein [Nocardioides terrisoli]|uniref:N-acyl-D-amino-acid deacylase family protein n=1 Tax=Nocardioides terrisoli TaxID=3388267 RepID=UPI00287BA088|nr:D-aminoacylase [Nocardioides marmorisolisilvae]